MSLTYMHYHVYNTRIVGVLVAQSSQALCNPIDCSPSGCSVYGILQVRILEWVGILFSRGSSRPRDQIQVFLIAEEEYLLPDSLQSEPPGKTILKYSCVQCEQIQRASLGGRAFTQFFSFQPPSYFSLPFAASAQSRGVSAACCQSAFQLPKFYCSCVLLCSLSCGFMLFKENFYSSFSGILQKNEMCSLFYHLNPENHLGPLCFF